MVKFTIALSLFPPIFHHGQSRVNPPKYTHQNASRRVRLTPLTLSLSMLAVPHHLLDGGTSTQSNSSKNEVLEVVIDQRPRLEIRERPGRLE
nr:hypothetical protein [Tanacetum cinerariifolium]